MARKTIDVNRYLIRCDIATHMMDDPHNDTAVFARLLSPDHVASKGLVV